MPAHVLKTLHHISIISRLNSLFDRHINDQHRFERMRYYRQEKVKILRMVFIAKLTKGFDLGKK